MTDTGSPSLLLVEDDEGIARPLEAALVGAGHRVVRVATGTHALDVLARDPDDVALVVLDLGLPDVDGVEVCGRIRRIDPRLPILILTARGSEADVVVGLDAGADDYVTKPFRLAELMARIRSLLRRAEPQGDGELRAQDVVVDLAARRAWRGAHELDLSPKEFDLLALLIREAGRVVERTRIMSEVWDTTWMGSTKTVDMHVSWLRRKLGDDAGDPRYIATVRGVGFRFEAERSDGDAAARRAPERGVTDAGTAPGDGA